MKIIKMFIGLFSAIGVVILANVIFRKNKNKFIDNIANNTSNEFKRKLLGEYLRQHKS